MLDHLIDSFFKQLQRGESWSNPFERHFGQLSDQQWTQALIKSIETSDVDGCLFPPFPSKELQATIHGHGGDIAILGAMEFRNFVRYNAPQDIFERPSRRLLDYGCGWGRISRTFLRDFPIENMYGFEPDKRLSAIARALNPYITITSGDFTPPTVFGSGAFDLIVGYSVFSHLPEQLAKDWLEEFARLLRPGGCIAITTWGERFIDRLMNEKAEMESGKEIHFYSKIVIEAAGNLHKLRGRYKGGDFVFLASQSEMYGETFLSLPAMERIIPKSLSVYKFDNTSLSQDAFLLVKR